jgi:hypothetical protein
VAFRQYRRKQIAELRPYIPGEEMSGISISAEDRNAGSPKAGDMIARNPKNHADQWLVAAKYFADNFEPTWVSGGVGTAWTAGDCAGLHGPVRPNPPEGREALRHVCRPKNKYDWVLKRVIVYPSVDRLIEVLEDEIVRPAEAKFNELLARRTNQLRVENA